MFRTFILLSALFLLPINSVSSSNFNYGSGFAAQSALKEKSLINAMEKIDDRIYAAGEHGIIIYSDDLGDTWTQAESVPYTSTITDLSCPTKKSCWVVGHDAVILHSNDYGKTWVKQYEDIDFIRDQIKDDLVSGAEKNGVKVLTMVDVGWVYWFSTEAVFTPDDLKSHNNKTCVIGLVADPERLSEIRRNRVAIMKENNIKEYTDLSFIKEKMSPL